MESNENGPLISGWADVLSTLKLTSNFFARGTERNLRIVRTNLTLHYRFLLTRFYYVYGVRARVQYRGGLGRGMDRARFELASADAMRGHWSAVLR